ncbi:MAG: helix-turn-helix domain-containing protein [Eubacteriales bacterium]
MLKNYFQVPNEIFDQEIHPTALLILLYLLRCRGADGLCYPSIQTMRKKLGLGKTSVIKYTKWLEDEGYIEKKLVFKDGRQSNNSYRLTEKNF